MLTSVILIVLSGILFALVHSMLAKNTFKSKCYALGLTQQHYRLAYTMIAVLSTVAWLIFTHSLPDRALYEVTGIWRWQLYAIQVAGLTLLVLSVKSVEIMPFLGLANFTNDTEPFREHGIYRIVRHPMYTGIMLLMYAQPSQSVNNLVLFTVIAIYFIVGSRFEESRMLDSHPEYRDYCRRVPAFIPGLKPGNRHSRHR